MGLQHDGGYFAPFSPAPFIREMIAKDLKEYCGYAIYAIWKHLDGLGSGDYYAQCARWRCNRSLGSKGRGDLMLNAQYYRK